MTSLSIVTVVYNAAETVGQCLASVQSQTHPVEHIVIDGGSTDGTMTVVEPHRSRLGALVSERDRGIYDAMNKGIALATGEFVGILNADDFYSHPRVLENVAQALSSQALDSCYGDLVYVDPNKTDRVVRYWRSGRYDPNRFFAGWMPPHPAFFVRRSVYEK